MISDNITVVQGTLGSGKSMVAVLEAIYQLREGGVVACNFTFVPEWAYELAGQDLGVWLGTKDRYEFACSLWDRCFKIGSPESMIELSGERGSKLSELCTGKRKGAREGKGLLIIDDAHHYFNARTFQANKEYVAFFANARKYGWRTIIITHDVENIDKQIRSYIEIEARFRNLQKVKIPFTPFSLSPFFPLFLIVRRYYGLGAGTGCKHSTDFYAMDKRAAKLYDTLERFHSSDVLQAYTHQGLHPSLYVPGKSNLQQYKKPIGPKKLLSKDIYYQRVVPWLSPYV